MLLAVVLPAACGGETKEDIVQQSRNVSTRAEIERALGQPSDIAKLGPMERWTYKASNGEVVLIIIGDAATNAGLRGREPIDGAAGGDDARARRTVSGPVRARVSVASLP